MKILLTSDTHYGISDQTHRIHTKFWKEVAKAIEQEGVSAVILAGDLIARRQVSLRQTLAHFRKYVKVPTVMVRGNHDFWDSAVEPFSDKPRRMPGFDELQRSHRELCKKFDITLLDREPLVIDNVLICGWDGWYGGTPNTKDARFMFRDVSGVPMHPFLSNKAWHDFEELLVSDVSSFRKTVAVSHFPPFCDHPRWDHMCANKRFYDLIVNKFDVFCCGHSHQFSDFVDGKCRILNSGSDYDRPKFSVFEV